MGLCKKDIMIYLLIHIPVFIVYEMVYAVDLICFFSLSDPIILYVLFHSGVSFAKGQKGNTVYELDVFNWTNDDEKRGMSTHRYTMLKS